MLFKDLDYGDSFMMEVYYKQHEVLKIDDNIAWSLKDKMSVVVSPNRVINKDDIVSLAHKTENVRKQPKVKAVEPDTNPHSDLPQ